MTVVVTHEELVQARIKMLKEMNKYIIEMEDEEILTIWIWVMGGFPDAPSKENYKSIAENDDKWKYICALFGELTAKKAD